MREGAVPLVFKGTGFDSLFVLTFLRQVGHPFDPKNLPGWPTLCGFGSAKGGADLPDLSP